MDFSPEEYRLSESIGQKMKLDAFMYLFRHLEIYQQFVNKYLTGLKGASKDSVNIYDADIFTLFHMLMSSADSSQETPSCKELINFICGDEKIQEDLDYEFIEQFLLNLNVLFKLETFFAIQDPASDPLKHSDALEEEKKSVMQALFDEPDPNFWTTDMPDILKNVMVDRMHIAKDQNMDLRAEFVQHLYKEFLKEGLHEKSVALFFQFLQQVVLCEDFMKKCQVLTRKYAIYSRIVKLAISILYKENRIDELLNVRNEALVKQTFHDINNLIKDSSASDFLYIMAHGGTGVSILKCHLKGNQSFNILSAHLQLTSESSKGGKDPKEIQVRFSVLIGEGKIWNKGRTVVSLRLRFELNVRPDPAKFPDQDLSQPAWPITFRATLAQLEPKLDLYSNISEDHFNICLYETGQTMAVCSDPDKPMNDIVQSCSGRIDIVSMFSQQSYSPEDFKVVFFRHAKTKPHSPKDGSWLLFLGTKNSTLKDLADFILGKDCKAEAVTELLKQLSFSTVTDVSSKKVKSTIEELAKSGEFLAAKTKLSTVESQLRKAGTHMEPVPAAESPQESPRRADRDRSSDKRVDLFCWVKPESKIELPTIPEEKVEEVVSIRANLSEFIEFALNYEKVDLNLKADFLLSRYYLADVEPIRNSLDLVNPLHFKTLDPYMENIAKTAFKNNRYSIVGYILVTQEPKVKYYDAAKLRKSLLSDLKKKSKTKDIFEEECKKRNLTELLTKDEKEFDALSSNIEVLYVRIIRMKKSQSSKKNETSERNYSLDSFTMKYQSTIKYIVYEMEEVE